MCSFVSIHSCARLCCVIEGIQGKVKKGKKTGDIKDVIVRRQLWVFVNTLIENPSFDSQTKETLTTRTTGFSSTADVPEKFIKER